MEWLHIAVLALIQGVTEFLPISSSGHLLLPAALLGWEDQGLAFDVAVHVGTLLAVVTYFRNSLWEMGRDWLGQVSGQRQATEHSRLAWFVIMATVPTALAGLLLDSLIETHLRTTLVLATTTIVFGLALGWADWRGARVHSLMDMTWKAALIVGLAQMLALIPGTSRSGITITAALLLGFTRHDAARFSFLLSVPIIALSGGYKALQLWLQSDGAPWGDLLMGAALAGLSAFVCIHYFMQYISRIGMQPFVVYRLLLGGVLLWVALS
ncbi:undecaprenyl-diphosphate phosphatase [Marinimicrobium sp. ARAG 43.8]|uniref:undecaprenyl-diphosphate phosphatase n=1 Tax=Marinimicrobium sp. ARAG 43.8 TaxID=3418719 RepID=UPI003CEF1841